MKAILKAASIGAVGGLVVNALIEQGVRATFDIPSEFRQLTIPVYGLLTVAGAFIGAIGWHIIVKRSRNSVRLLSWLVPTVLALSMIPTAMLLVSDSQPGTTTAGVVALMVMHLGVALPAIPAYVRFMPPSRESRAHADLPAGEVLR